MRLCTTLSATILVGCVATSVAADETPTASDLYNAFRASRIEISKSGPAGTLQFYSRPWLEYQLRSAFRAAEQPRGPIDYVKDSLWAGFQGLGIITAVYTYRLLADAEGRPTLELHATVGECEQPQVIAFSFVNEGGVWRATHKSSDSTLKGNTWLTPGLEPLDRFPRFEPLDRTDYWNEWRLENGIALRDKKPCQPRK